MQYLLIIVVIIALIAIWVISVQRKLVNQDELCGNSLSQIGVQQNSRWDALSALADLTKSYSEHEYNTIKDIIAQRRNIDGNSSASEVENQENKITEALTHIIAISESYPDLKANTTYVETMKSVNTYENQVRMSRMVYNDSVTKYNRLIRQMPSNIVANMFGFGLRDYLETEEGKTSMPDMSI